jgi:hypothetical protein
MLSAEIQDSFTGHELHGGHLTVSPHLRWLASCAPDGNLIIRAVGALVRFWYILFYSQWNIVYYWQTERPEMREISEVYSFIVDFNLLFTKMFRTSQIRCKVQKLIMKFTNQFVNWAFDWLVWFSSQSEALFTNLLVNCIMNFWTLQRICEVRNILVKSKLKSTITAIRFSIRNTFSLATLVYVIHTVSVEASEEMLFSITRRTE